MIIYFILFQIFSDTGLVPAPTENRGKVTSFFDRLLQKGLFSSPACRRHFRLTARTAKTGPNLRLATQNLARVSLHARFRQEGDLPFRQSCGEPKAAPANPTRPSPRTAPGSPPKRKDSPPRAAYRKPCPPSTSCCVPRKSCEPHTPVPARARIPPVCRHSKAASKAESRLFDEVLRPDEIR